MAIDGDCLGIWGFLLGLLLVLVEGELHGRDSIEDACVDKDCTDNGRDIALEETGGALGGEDELIVGGEARGEGGAGRVGGESGEGILGGKGRGGRRNGWGREDGGRGGGRWRGKGGE